MQKHLPNGGTFLGGDTYSRLLTNAEYLTSWLDGLVRTLNWLLAGL